MHVEEFRYFFSILFWIWEYNRCCFVGFPEDTDVLQKLDIVLESALGHHTSGT